MRRHHAVVWSLDMDDQQRLVSAFMQVDGVRRRSSRNLYLALLERELGHPLALIRHEQDLHDVWQLVDTCLGHAGAVHTLLQVMKRFHGGSRPMAAVCDLVDELLPEPLLSQPERRELRALITELERSGLRTAYVALYQQAVGPVGPTLRHDVRDLHGVVALLEDVATGSDGVPPLLHFVDDLAWRANGTTAGALRAWAHRFAERRGLHQGRLRHLEAQADYFETYLVIECRPDAAGSDQFLLTAWLQIGDEPGITLQCEDQPQPLGRLPLHLQSLLNDHPLVVNRTNPELTIEFVLPRSLLGIPFDQFKITVDGLERRLGIDYPVVMRSLDRMRRRAMHHNWRQKWEWLRADPAQVTVHWIDRPREIADEQLYARLKDPSSAVLAMAFPPWRDRPAPVDELWVGLQAGIPIIAWCREARDPHRFSAETAGLLGSDPMAVPRKVRRLRQEAVDTGGDDLGLHLALIFDDADRLPEPYIRLTPPA
jgi:hypothetical protein